MAERSVYPGEHLASKLEEYGMSAAELARRLKIPAVDIADILNGRSAITVDMAVQFAHAFDTSARFWLDLQNHYDITRNQGKAARA
jgi:addiction module HigA family antidote